MIETTGTRVRAVFIAHTWMCAQLYNTFKNIKCTSIVESKPKILLKPRAKHSAVIMDFGLCTRLSEGCASFSTSEFKVWLLASERITETLVRKQVDNLMRSLEDGMRTKPTLCAGRGFSPFFRADAMAQ